MLTTTTVVVFADVKRTSSAFAANWSSLRRDIDIMDVDVATGPKGRRANGPGARESRDDTGETGRTVPGLTGSGRKRRRRRIRVEIARFMTRLFGTVAEDRQRFVGPVALNHFSQCVNLCNC